jgi:hypothetical protein
MCKGRGREIIIGHEDRERTGMRECESGIMIQRKKGRKIKVK